MSHKTTEKHPQACLYNSCRDNSAPVIDTGNISDCVLAVLTPGSLLKPVSLSSNEQSAERGMFSRIKLKGILTASLPTVQAVPLMNKP